MALLEVDGISVSFGGLQALNKVTLNVEPGCIYGLIGPNGVGKSTIMMILAGLRTPTTGQVSMAKNRSIGYLRQEAVEAFGSRDNSVYTEMLAVFEHLHQRQAQLHELEVQMADSNGNLDTLLAEYGRLQEAFELVLFIQDDILRHRHMRAQCQFLVDGVNGCADRVLRISKYYRLASDEHFAAFVRRVISAQDLNQRGLTSPVLAQQGMHFAAPHPHIDVLEGYYARKSLADMPQLEDVLTC